jgi:hypothetical protein
MKTYLILLFVLTFLINRYSFGQILSDDQLYENGYYEVQKQNWPEASAYLFAYIQRNPIVFVKDQVYKQQVINAYNASIKNIESEMVRLTKEISGKDYYIQSLEERLNIPASTSQGLTSFPEMPPLKPPVQAEMRILRLQGRPLSGQWQATLTSSGGSVFTGTLIVVANEDVVTGSFILSDLSDSNITGMYDGENLVLMRNTGAITIQTYTMKMLDENHFSGFYKNDGRIPDDGMIDLVR